MINNRLHAIGYLFIPYLIIVALTDAVAALLNYFLFSRLLNLPSANAVIISLMLLTFALLSLYRPVVEGVTANWADRAEGSPWDIILAAPGMMILLLNVGGDFGWFMAAFTIGQVIWLICVAASGPTLRVAQQYSKLTEEELIKKVRKDFIKTFKYLMPSKGIVFTPMFALLLSGIFLLMMLTGVNGFKPSPVELTTWGSAHSSQVGDSLQHWRLVTTGFIQRGVIQMVCAVTCVVGCGRLLEKMIGAPATGIIFIVSLISASVSWLMFGSTYDIVGSHFAAMGLVGAMFLYTLFDIGSRNNRGMFILNLVGFGALAVFTEYIDSEFTDEMNAAGLVGGFVGGIVAGISYIPAVRRAKDIE